MRHPHGKIRSDAANDYTQWFMGCGDGIRTRSTQIISLLHSHLMLRHNGKSTISGSLVSLQNSRRPLNALACCVPSLPAVIRVELARNEIEGLKLLTALLVSSEVSHLIATMVSRCRAFAMTCTFRLPVGLGILSRNPRTAATHVPYDVLLKQGIFGRGADD